ncbi:MAG: ATPase [Gorillibacterium sp.]|nr:ATPase [Gorillibacterium sp.]
MLRLGQKVFIMDDSLEQNLPIGEHGYIIAYDRNADNIFDYVVRIPNHNRHVMVPSHDIDTEESILEQEVDMIEREALLDFALATRNEELFRRLMNGEQTEQVEEVEEVSREATSQEQFIKQINLKAWI